MSAPYISGLRSELMRAVGAQREVRVARQRRTVSLSAAAAALATVGVLTLSGGPRPALAIAAASDGVEVSIVDAAADPAAMTRQLAEAGLDVVVVAQPVPAELAGQWVGATGRFLDLTTRSVTLPPDARGVVLRVGVATGAPSAYAGSAFAPGGLLACSGLQGAPAVDVAAELEHRGLRHTWRSPDGAVLDAAPAGVVVVDATLTSDGTLVLATASTSHVEPRCE